MNDADIASHAAICPLQLLSRPLYLANSLVQHEKKITQQSKCKCMLLNAGLNLAINSNRQPLQTFLLVSQ